MKKFFSILVALLSVPFLIDLWALYANDITNKLIFVLTVTAYAWIWIVHIKFYRLNRKGILPKVLLALLCTPIIIYSGYRLLLGQNHQTLEMFALSSSFGIFWALAIRINDSQF
jgi:hypothetical protein